MKALMVNIACTIVEGIFWTVVLHIKGRSKTVNRKHSKTNLEKQTQPQKVKK